MCHVALVALSTAYGEQGAGRGAAGRVLLHIRPLTREDATPPVSHPQKPARVPVQQTLEAPQRLEPNTASPAPPSVLPSPAQGSDEAGVSAYIPSELLSTHPRILDTADAIMPPELGRTESGRLVVQLLVNETGEVDQVIVQGSELSPAGTRLFVQRLAQLHLAPGRMSDQPVKALLRLEFRLDADRPVTSAH